MNNTHARDTAFLTRTAGAGVSRGAARRPSNVFGLQSLKALLQLRDDVIAAGQALRAHRRAYWSYTGPAAGAPMSPEAAQAAYTETVNQAVTAYLRATSRAAPLHH